MNRNKMFYYHHFPDKGDQDYPLGDRDYGSPDVWMVSWTVPSKIPHVGYTRDICIVGPTAIWLNRIGRAGTWCKGFWCNSVMKFNRRIGGEWQVYHGHPDPRRAYRGTNLRGRFTLWLLRLNIPVLRFVLWPLSVIHEVLSRPVFKAAEKALPVPQGMPRNITLTATVGGCR